nr:protein kinase superfamily protein [Tanacetum cinerariifolium]
MPIAKSGPKIEHIGSSSRTQLSVTISDITPPEQSNYEEQPANPSFITPKDNRGTSIARDTNECLRKLVPASKEAHMEEEKLERAAQEEKLIELNKHALIKVVEEVASEAEVDPNALHGKKGGQEFLKQHDVRFKVHQREHMTKLKKSIKRNAHELEHEFHIARLECNRCILERISFMNNKVMETLEHGIFFMDALDKQAFQRVSDIYKVEVETLLGYLVMAENVNTLEKPNILCTVETND